MKAKVLLSTMVLAAAFAGCSQDEWGENNANTSNLDNRRAVGKVELSLSEPSTRMEQTEDGKIVFSADDKVGAALMDEFNGFYPIGNLVNYAQTNYPFQQEGDVWKSTGVLLEGNYFFTYPFNACQQSRGAVTNTVPVDQKVYDENGEFNGLQSYLDNQFYAGYKYLHADADCTDCDEVGTLTAHVNMEMIHAYPSFQFVNQTGSPLDQPLKVYKVSLRKKNETPFYNTVAIFPNTKNFKSDPNSEQSKYDLWKTAVYNRNMGDQGNAAPFDANEICASKTLEYNLIFPEGGLEVQNWSDFKVYMIVPAGIYGEMQVILYTNEGVGTFDVDMPNNADDSQVQSGTYALTPAKKASFNVRVDINSLKTNKCKFTVQSTENLVEYLTYIENTGNDTKIELTTKGEEVELSQEVYNILKNKNLKLKLHGTLVIPEGVPADAIDRIDYYYAGAKLINKGTQTITETPMKEKATLGAANVRIDNLGTLTLEAAMPASLINNFNTLNVEKSSVHTLVNIPNATTNVNEELNIINLLNLGKMNVAANAKVNVLSKWFNYGNTANEGTITTWPMNMSEANPFIDIDFVSVDVVWVKLIPTLKIVNNVYVAFVTASAEAVNYGEIVNNGIIDSKGVKIISSETKYFNAFPLYIKEWNITGEVAAVTSLVNLGSASNISNYGRITNLSNFGMLVPQPGSYASLVDVEVTDLDALSETKEAAELYVQGALAFYGYGFIDMSENDGVAVSSQAILNDNSGKALNSDQQIIFVKRTGATNFDMSCSESSSSAPQYINTIWFEDASTTITSIVDISDYDFWMSGTNTITVQQSVDLTLGSTSIEGTATIKGAGTVNLTQDIYVNGGTFNADAANWEADIPVTIWGANREDNTLNVGGIKNKNINVDYSSFDYVGPWVVIELD